MNTARFTRPSHSIIAAAIAAFAVVFTTSRGANAQAAPGSSEQWIVVDTMTSPNSASPPPLRYRHHPWVTASGMTLVTTGIVIMVPSLIMIASGIQQDMLCARSTRCFEGGGLAEGIGLAGVLASLVFSLPGSLLWMGGSWRHPTTRSARITSPLPDLAVGPRSVSFRWTF